jgi:hypothetical protein
MVAGREHLTVEDVASHEDCQLGQWYYNQGKKDFKGMAQFVNLEDPHIRLHKEVSRIVSDYNQGNVVNAASGVKTVELLSHTVVGILDDMEHNTIEWLENGKNGKNGKTS